MSAVRKIIKSGTDEVAWQQYVDEMKAQKPEEYLAGSVEGYRHGYAEGVGAEKQSRADFSFFGSILAMMLAACGGFLIGLAW